MVKKEDLKLFMSETEDLIQQIEEAILELETSPRSKEAVQNLYFAFHTLKGLTGMVGLENLSRLCHNFEDFLDKNKDTKKILKNPSDFINFLFEGFDVLRTMSDHIKKGELVDIDTQFLNEIGRTFDELEENYEISFISPLEESEIKLLIGNSKEKFFKIYIRIQASCVFKKVRLFIIFRALNAIGRLVYSNPTPELLEGGHFENDFELYFMTKDNKEQIQGVLNEILEIETLTITELSNEEFSNVVYKNVPTKTATEIDLNYSFNAKEVTKSPLASIISSDSFEIQDKVEAKTRITSIKVDIEILERLMNLFGELIVVKNQISQIMKDKQVWEVNRLFDNMDKHFLEIQEVIFQLKLVTVGSVFRRFRRLVRDLAKDHGKEVKLLLEGMEVEIDRKILEEISSPIIHLIRNSISHGIETPKERKLAKKIPEGLLRIRAYRQAGSIYIEVQDDGRGIDFEAIRQKLVDEGYYSTDDVKDLPEEILIQFILQPGFSTAQEVDLTSGRGMGLAIFQNKIRELSGSFKIESKPNKGTKITLNVPFTRAILKAQLIEVADDLFAIPLSNIKQIFQFNLKSIEYVKGKEFYQIHSKLIPVIRLNELFNIKTMDENTSNADTGSKVAIWAIRDGNNSAMLIADNVRQQMEIVVKPFRSLYSTVKGISGVTITGDGSICLVLDILELIESKVNDANESIFAESIS